MRHLPTLLALPATLLSFIGNTIVNAQELQWPYNLPRTAKYFPEHEAHIKRHLRIQERLAWHPPAGVKKMSDDEGEKFFLDYWDFGAGIAPPDGRGDGVYCSRRPGCLHGSEDYNNASLASVLYPVFAMHTEHGRPRFRLLGRSLFERGYQCPAGTTSCASAGAPNSCCQTGETCISVTDTGYGSVGCCPAGSSCGSTVAGCDASQGYTSCPGSAGGGCCIPGYACQGVGCVVAVTQTVVLTLPVATVTAAQSSVASSSSDTAVVVASVSGYATTATTTVSIPTTVVIAPTPPTTSSTTRSPISCLPKYTTCPVALGGGCCSSGLLCGTGASCIETYTATSTAIAGPPYRPTSNTDTPTTVQSVTTSSPSTTYSGCPTGFYMCSAYYLGGCCRVGRNCDTTSCPSPANTEVVSGNPTILAQTSTTTVSGGGTTGAVGNAAATATQRSCAGGWYSCPASVGGGCCPSGYLCGSDCQATVSGVSNQPKAAASGASVVGWGWSFAMLGLVAGVGMVLL